MSGHFLQDLLYALLVYQVKKLVHHLPINQWAKHLPRIYSFDNHNFPINTLTTSEENLSKEFVAQLKSFAITSLSFIPS